jgi:hypothetical protein
MDFLSLLWYLSIFVLFLAPLLLREPVVSPPIKRRTFSVPFRVRFVKFTSLLEMLPVWRLVSASVSGSDNGVPGVQWALPRGHTWGTIAPDKQSSLAFKVHWNDV